MRTGLLLVLSCFLLLPATPAASQSGTFDFESAADHGPTVSQTIDGVTLTVSTDSNAATLFDPGGYGGTSGLVVYSGSGIWISTMTLTFSEPVNITTLRATDGNGRDFTYVFTPDTGDPVTHLVNGDSLGGTTVALNVVDVTAIVITTSDTSEYAPGEYGPLFQPVLDNIEMNDALPVELTTFTALADGAAATLHWQTASETNNAGFEVQHQAPAADAFIPAGFVEGHGSTNEPQAYQHTVAGLTPGAHRFRLKQVDFDGAFEYSPEIDVAIELPGTHALDAYPNPFNPATTIAVSLAQRQRVTLAVYDLLGRRVTLLHEGLLEGNHTHIFRFDASTLPSGSYFVRIVGDSFSDVRPVQLVR